MPNRLVDAASPYLRSHANNPVDWWQWSPEAFAEAERRDVPVLVSIGYSTCHWCHVMARESFSDPAIAQLLNDNFVSIKVDREEHAEVDSTYMAAAGAFTPNLGWPLNVFVTPQGRAFFAGTYWPPEPVGQHPAFRQVLEGVLGAWRERRADVERSGAAIVEALGASRAAGASAPVDFVEVVAALEALEDRQFGGFGGAPKFPVSPVLRFLVERREPLGTRILDAMAGSALRDLDGGFFRYSTRRDWTEPHYERMLYDNAQLLACYALAGRAEIATGIADFLLGTLQLPAGGFASAQDSESTVDGQRVEGFYYSLDAANRARFEAPPLDEKVLTGLNGLAIEGLAIAGVALERADWVAAAVRAAEFVLEQHVLSGRLVRASIGGVASAATSTLEDYGMLASGLTHLATATGEVRFATAARELVDSALAAGSRGAPGSVLAAGTPFGLPGGGDPLLAAHGIHAPADESDGAHPSGLAAMAAACCRVYLLTAHAPYRAAAVAAMERVDAAAQPLAYGAALAVMSQLAESVRQVVVVTDDPAALLAVAARKLSGLVSVVTPSQAREFSAAGFELFEGRALVGGLPTAYACTDFVCRLPVTDVAGLG